MRLLMRLVSGFSQGGRSCAAGCRNALVYVSDAGRCEGRKDVGVRLPAWDRA
jgi:hypothetical protein